MAHIILNEAEAEAILEGTLVGVAPSFPPPIKEIYLASWTSMSQDGMFVSLSHERIFLTVEEAQAYLDSVPRGERPFGAFPYINKIPFGG